MGILKKGTKTFRKISKGLGLMTALRYSAAVLRRQRHFHISTDGLDVTVRVSSPDIRVAIDTLGSEFDALAGVVDRNFDGLIVDAGGYIGTAALKLGSMFPKASIITIEPSPDNYAILSLNIAQNRRIKAVHAALAPKAGETVELRDRGTGHWGLTIIEAPRDRAEAPRLASVRTTSLKEIMDQNPGTRIGLLKLDIEGAEKALFDQTPDVLRSIPVIMAELHERIVAGCEASFVAASEGRKVMPLGHEKMMSVQQPSNMQPLSG